MCSDPIVEAYRERQRVRELHPFAPGRREEPDAAIAERFGTDRTTVRRRAERAGIYKPAASKLERQQRAVALHRSGMSLAEIAAELGVQAVTVRALYLKGEGIRLPRPSNRKLGDGPIALHAPVHGRESSYTNHACRCESCRWAASDARWDRVRRQRGAPPA